MSKRQRFINSVIHILAHNRGGSYRTRDDRQRCLLKITNDLYRDGFQLDHVRYLKPKHIWHLVQRWQESISVGTIKNRLSRLRWLLEKLNKQSIVPSNDRLGVQRRHYVTNENKARRYCSPRLMSFAM